MTSDFQLVGSIILKIDLKNSFVILPEPEKLKLKMNAEYEINQICAAECGMEGTISLEVVATAKKISLSSQAMNGGQLILPMVNFFKMKEEKEKLDQ